MRFSLLHDAQLLQTLADRCQSMPGALLGYYPPSPLSLQNWPIYVCLDLSCCWAWGSPSAGHHLPHLENQDLLLNGGSSTPPLCAFQGPVHPGALRPLNGFLFLQGYSSTPHTVHSPFVAGFTAHSEGLVIL